MQKYDMDGNPINEDMWKHLLSIANYGVVADEEIETENVRVRTRWTGAPRRSRPGSKMGLFETTVWIPWSVFDIESIVRREDLMGYCVNSWESESWRMAREQHDQILYSIYGGYMRVGIDMALRSGAMAAVERVNVHERKIVEMPDIYGRLGRR